MASGLLKDEIVNLIPEHTDFIGVSCMFSQDWPYAKQVIDSIRACFPDITILAGGEHIIAMPEFVLETCPAIDYCILGEGEETLVALVNNLNASLPDEEINGIAYMRDGDFIKTPPRARIRNIDDIPLPAWHLVPLENYLDNGLGYGVNRGRSMPMLATRGCPYRCTFCSSPFMWTTAWLARKPELVLDEIQYYIEKYNISNIDFYDLTAIVRKDWIVKFCQLIKERKMNFTWQLPSGTRSEALDEEVCALIYEAGCRNMSYAPESGSPRILAQIKKKVKLERMLRSMRYAIKSKINTKMNIIVGFPDETRKDVLLSIRFIAQAAWVGVNDVLVSVYSPYPGSELFDNLKKEGKIVEFDNDYFFALTCYIDPTQAISWSKHMSSRELLVYRLVCFLVFYGIQFTTRPWRLFKLLTNMFKDHEESRLDKVVQDYLRRNYKSLKVRKKALPKEL